MNINFPRLFYFIEEVLQLAEENKDDANTTNCPVHLLVTGVIEPSVVYE